MTGGFLVHGISPLPDRLAVRSALGILAVHNVVQNLILNERGYVTGNLAVSAVLMGLGRGSGSTWDEMGFGRPDVRATLGYGAVAMVTSTAGAVIAMTNTRTRGLLLDKRAQVAGWREMMQRAVVRFPLGTAIFEEIGFRGVLPALLGRNRAPWRGDALAAGVFALWHLIPTARVQAGNALAQDQPRHRRATSVVVGSVAAGVAGLGLSWLRRRTGSLLAPWLVHASVNSIAFLAGVAAHRGSGRRP